MSSGSESAACASSIACCSVFKRAKAFTTGSMSLRSLFSFLSSLGSDRIAGSQRSWLTSSKRRSSDWSLSMGSMGLFDPRWWRSANYGRQTRRGARSVRPQRLDDTPWTIVTRASWRGRTSCGAVDATCGVEQLLLAREERVAVRADVDAEVTGGRVRLVDGSARAGDVGLGVRGVDSGLHGAVPIGARRQHLEGPPRAGLADIAFAGHFRKGAVIWATSNGPRTALHVPCLAPVDGPSHMVRLLS